MEMIIDFPWYYTVLCLMAGAAYATVLYFVGRSPFKPLWRWILAGVRFLCVSCIAFLLLAPMSQRTVHERQRPHIVLLQDASLSVRSTADSAFSLEALKEQLGDRYRVSYETFGNAASTDIGSAMGRYADDDVAAMVIATDGLYNRGANPATLAERLPFPIHTVALGDTTRRRDASLGNLRCNRIALMGNSFPVEFTVNSTLLHGQSAQLTIHDADGKVLHRETVDYGADRTSTGVSASLPAPKPGLQRYSARLTVAEGEVNSANNVLTFYVDVIDTRRKVAVVANAPHPDIAALKRAIESNPNYEVRCLWADEIRNPKFNLQDSGYSLAVLHNLPSRSHSDIRYAEGLPQLYIIGLQTDLARFNALHSGLEIVAKVQRTNEVTAVRQTGFTLFTLGDDDASAIEALPPLEALFGEARTGADVQSLFTAKVGPVDSRQPLVAATTQGGERRVFVWGEGLWRWRLADYEEHQSHDHVDRLVSQMVGFAAMQSGRERLQVDAQRSYAEGEPIVLRAQLYNESYEPVNDATVRLTLTGGDSKGDYTFVRDGSGYRLTLPALKEGLYRYRATADGGISTEGSFAVEAIGLELHNLTADHSLLHTVSTVTGGEMFHPNELSTLNSQLSTLKPVIYSHTRYSELLRLPWVLVLLVLLLAVEWAGRKYNGEI